jgi:hypothetical protein
VPGDLLFPYPRVECTEHGWQDTIGLTVYDRKSKPRDRLDRLICAVCLRDGKAATKENSIRIGPLDTA